MHSKARSVEGHFNPTKEIRKQHQLLEGLSEAINETGKVDCPLRTAAGLESPTGVSLQQGRRHGMTAGNITASSQMDETLNSSTSCLAASTAPLASRGTCRSAGTRMLLMPQGGRWSSRKLRLKMTVQRCQQTSAPRCLKIDCPKDIPALCIVSKGQAICLFSTIASGRCDKTPLDHG